MKVGWKLSPVKLPNLLHLILSTRKETNHLFERHHSTHAYLYHKIVEVGDAKQTARRAEPDYVLPEGMSEGEDLYINSTSFGIVECYTHDKFFKSLDSRNVEIVRSLLAPVGAQLRTLRLPLDDFARKNPCYGQEEEEDFFYEPRLPFSNKNAKDLVVSLTFESLNGSVSRAMKTLSAQLSLEARFQVKCET